MSEPKSIKDRLKAAKLPERSLQVCLRGDLAAEFDDLERQLQEARETTGRKRVGSKSDAQQIVEKMDALREQMAEEMLDIKVRALPRREWLELTKKYPPREDERLDEAMGVNLVPLMEEAIPRCVVEPELDEDDWKQLDSVLASSEYDKLLNAVFAVNRNEVDIPKSRLASLVMAERDAD